MNYIYSNIEKTPDGEFVDLEKAVSYIETLVAAKRKIKIDADNKDGANKVGIRYSTGKLHIATGLILFTVQLLLVFFSLKTNSININFFLLIYVY